MRTILRVMYFLFFFSFSSYAQMQYEDYVSSETIFIDDFSNNKLGWFTGMSADSCYYSKIENGAFQITSTCKGKHPQYWMIKTIDATRDFEIEAKLLYVQGENDNAISLIWGKDGNNNLFLFGISGNGQYKICQYNGSWINLKDWTISDLIHTSDYNKLTIRKIGTWYYFFLNEQLVHTSDFYPFFGNQIGFQDNQNTTMKINYLKVSYLNPNPGAILESSRLDGSLGVGYIHSIGEIQDLWKDGFDMDMLLGYRVLRNFGFEFGLNIGITGIAEDKKVTVDVSDSYGNTSTRTSSGGYYYSFPLGLKFTFPIFSGSKFLTIGGGGNYYCTNESGFTNVSDYEPRGSSGFGYYARASFFWLENIKSGFGWGFQIRYTVNGAHVSDFYRNADGAVTKSHSPDARLVFLVEIGML